MTRDSLLFFYHHTFLSWNFCLAASPSGGWPFFLCLLGSRYGWVPDELPPEEM